MSRTNQQNVSDQERHRPLRTNWQWSQQHHFSAISRKDYTVQIIKEHLIHSHRYITYTPKVSEPQGIDADYI